VSPDDTSVPSHAADRARQPGSLPHPDAVLADLLARSDVADAEGPGGPLPDLLTDLLGPEVEEARRARREERTRLAAYLDDLAAVLRAGGGAGVRVLRHWLDAACANDRLSRPEPAIHGAAALYDYARDRTAEIAMADPASLLRIQLEGARRWAGEQLNPGGRRD
jgi:hypothetical protein